MRKSSGSLRFKVIVLCLLALPGLAAVKRSHPVDREVVGKTEASAPVLVGGLATLDPCRPQRTQPVEGSMQGRLERQDHASVDCIDAEADGPVQVSQGGLAAPHRIVHAMVDVGVADDAKVATDPRAPSR